MKKLLLISICILSLTFAGSAATSSSKMSQTTVKKETPAHKKGLKKAHTHKAGTKKVDTTPIAK